MINLTMTSSQELAPQGIRVNAISPGMVPTEAFHQVLGITDAELPEFAAKVPLGRLGTPEDMAAAVVYFASPAASWVTGQNILISGGRQPRPLGRGQALMTGVGVCLPQLGPHTSGAVVHDFCVKAETMGFTSLWVQEHLFYPLEPESGYANLPGRPIPQPYRSTLAATELLMAAAAWTDVVTVGTSVLVGGYHRPIELASRLATIDVLSGGRLVVGLSVGWSNDEHEQMDVTTDRRGARLEELVAALIACWGPDPVAFDGEFFHIPKCEIDPKPLQQPRPSLISGLWGPVGLRRTARASTARNPARGNPSAILPVLEGHGRHPPDGMAPWTSGTGRSSGAWGLGSAGRDVRPGRRGQRARLPGGDHRRQLLRRHRLAPSLARRPGPPGPRPLTNCRDFQRTLSTNPHKCAGAAGHGNMGPCTGTITATITGTVLGADPAAGLGPGHQRAAGGRPGGRRGRDFGSLSLTHAAHQLVDVVALGSVLLAQWLASRPAGGRRTYGWQRADVLASLACATLLLASSVWIVVEAVGRIGETVEIDGPGWWRWPSSAWP